MDQIIPLTSAPNQTLTITPIVDGNSLTLQLGIRFAEIAQEWVMTISDKSGNLLLDSIPMLTGEWPAANFLSPYGYLKIGSAYVINASGVALDNPSSTDLGSDFYLLWSDTAS